MHIRPAYAVSATTPRPAPRLTEGLDVPRGLTVNVQNDEGDSRRTGHGAPRLSRWVPALVDHGHSQVGDLVPYRPLVQVRLEQGVHERGPDEHGLQVGGRPRVGQVASAHRAFEHLCDLIAAVSDKRRL